MSRPAAPVEYNASIIEREDLSETLARFAIRPDVLPGPGAFVAGQYMVLGLNDDLRPELGGVRRPMSVASAPSRGDALEFYIRLVTQPTSENPFTPLLWRCEEGARIHIRVRPAGHLTLASTVSAGDPRMKVLVAAGTGLAPFLSIVREVAAADPSRPLDDFAVLHGASYPEELGFRDELERLARDRGLRYLPTLSRAREDDGWAGARGRVEDLFLADRFAGTEEALGLATGGFDTANCGVLICGLHGTIAMTIERLLPRGFEPDHVATRRALGLAEDGPPTMFYEKYDVAPLLDIHDQAEIRRLRALIPKRGETRP
jgi:ferredoxin--NADP+ reductase